MDRRRFLTRGLLAGGAGAAALSPLALDAVDPAEHGAKADGRADDSAALQAAVDRGDGVIRLARGTYRITKPIEIDLSKVDRTAIVGDGVAGVVMAGAGPAFRFRGTHGGTADPASVKPRVWDKERLPLVEGIEIVGEHEDAIGIELTGTMQSTITSTLIRRCKIGISYTKRNRNIIVDHCHIYENREIGILFDQVNLHQALITGSHISYNPVAGIWFRGGELRNFQIVGNDIEYNYSMKREGSADVLIDVSEKGATFREGTIVGNTIQARPSPRGANVRVIGGDGLRTTGMLSITGNLIGSQHDAIHLKRARAVAVTGNTIYSATNRDLVVEDCANIVLGSNSIDWNPDHRGKRTVDGIVLRRSDGVVLSDTIIENSFAGSEERGGTIEIDDCRDVTISACQVLDPKHRGIVINDSERVRVSATTVVDRREKPTMRSTIEVTGKSRNNVIRDNTLAKGRLKVAPGTAVADTNLEC